MAYATAPARLIVTAETDPEWLAATRPGDAMIVLLANDAPIWGGVVTGRVRNGADNVDLTLTTIPGYWRRRFVGNETFAAVDQNVIVGTLATNYGAFEGTPLIVDIAPSAFTRNRTYYDDDDKSLFDALSELSGVENGPEWVVEWSVQDYGGQVAYWPVLVVRDRLGTTPNAGMDPESTWSFPGAIMKCTLTEDYSDGRGANDIMAVSSAVENVRPQSAHATVPGDDRIKWEDRFTPSTSIAEVSRLTSHALAKLARISDGSRLVELPLIAESARPGVDYRIGDIVGIRIGASGESLPAYPDGGLIARARVVGFRADPLGVETVTPFVTDLEVIRGRF